MLPAVIELELYLLLSSTIEIHVSIIRYTVFIHRLFFVLILSQ